MARTLLSLSVLVALLGAAPGGDDVVVLGKTRTEWIKLFYKEDAKEIKFRRAALIALEVYGPKQEGILPALLERLKIEPVDDLRQEIAQTLGRMGPDAKDGIKGLATALQTDKSAAVREAAAKALGGSMVPYSRKAVKELAAALRDAEPGPRTAAAETLKELGIDALPALSELLEAGRHPKLEEATKVYVLQALARFGSQSAAQTAPLFEQVLVGESNPLAVRVAAAESLGRIGADGSSAIGALKNSMAQGAKELPLRKAAILAFGKVGGPSKDTWPALKTLLSDEDSFMRLQAVRLSGPLGKDIAEVIPKLEAAALSDQSIEVRVAAVQELGALGPAASSTVKTLESISLTGGSPALRDAAKAALKKVKADS